MPVRALTARRRAISLTSLIDVIFLLLLFFMLSSTFTRFSEIQLSAAASGGGAVPQTPPLFLRIGADTLTLNGTATDLDMIATRISERIDGPAVVLVTAQNDVTSQRLVDLLVTIGSIPAITITVLD